LWKAVAIKHARHNATIALVLRTAEHTAGENMIPKQEAELLVATIAKLSKVIVPVEAALEAMYTVELTRYNPVKNRGVNYIKSAPPKTLEAAE
jgi:2-keto-3-deoxy-L-rhamnonate aldolase RhmA